MVFLQFRHLQYLQSCLYINIKKLSIFLLWAIFNTCRISTLSYFGEDCFYSYGHYGLISLEYMCRLFMQNFLAKLSTCNTIILKAHMVLFASVLIAGFITVLCVPSFQCLGLVFRWVWNLCQLYCLPLKSLDHCLHLPNPKSKCITVCTVNFFLLKYCIFWYHTHDGERLQIFCNFYYVLPKGLTCI